MNKSMMGKHREDDGGTVVQQGGARNEAKTKFLGLFVSLSVQKAEINKGNKTKKCTEQDENT